MPEELCPISLLRVDISVIYHVSVRYQVARHCHIQYSYENSLLSSHVLDYRAYVHKVVRLSL
jgi:hypothetical protein